VPGEGAAGSGWRVKPLLIGEANPYGTAPEYALWPEPRRASGGRLMRLLDMSRAQYMIAFDRVDLCDQIWRGGYARDMAQAILATRAGPLVLLGARVAGAFGLVYEPFTVVRGKCYLVPHPSGRNRAWQEPGAAARLRLFLAPLLEEVPHG
jgi:hypothetical protein